MKIGTLVLLSLSLLLSMSGCSSDSDSGSDSGSGSNLTGEPVVIARAPDAQNAISSISATSEISDTFPSVLKI